jgi:hypothetical protein
MEEHTLSGAILLRNRMTDTDYAYYTDHLEEEDTLTLQEKEDAVMYIVVLKNQDLPTYHFWKQGVAKPENPDRIIIQRREDVERLHRCTRELAQKITQLLDFLNTPVTMLQKQDHARSIFSDMARDLLRLGIPEALDLASTMLGYRERLEMYDLDDWSDADEQAATDTHSESRKKARKSGRVRRSKPTWKIPLNARAPEPYLSDSESDPEMASESDYRSESEPEPGWVYEHQPTSEEREQYLAEDYSVRGSELESDEWPEAESSSAPEYGEEFDEYSEPWSPVQDEDEETVAYTERRTRAEHKPINLFRNWRPFLNLDGSDPLDPSTRYKQRRHVAGSSSDEDEGMSNEDEEAEKEEEVKEQDKSQSRFTLPPMVQKRKSSKGPEEDPHAQKRRKTAPPEPQSVRRSARISGKRAG